MADFSHLRALNAVAYQALIDRGERPTDEMLLDGINGLEPPPFDRATMANLANELDPKSIRQRGRPLGDTLWRKVFAAELEAFDSTILPNLLRDTLIARLNDGKRYTDLDRGLPFYKQRQRRDRDMFIRGLYRRCYEILGEAPPFVHPVLGSLDEIVPSENMSRSTKALVMASVIIRDRLGFGPPSLGRMKNICSGKSFLKT